MLKSYLQHQLGRALRGEITNGLHNCHVEGLDSIMFHAEPGNRVRMFVTADGVHDLWRNKALNYSHHLSLAIHPHHCDVRFVGIHGDVRNHVYAVVPDPAGLLQEMDYTSGVLHGTGVLTPTGRRGTGILIREERLNTNPAMVANEMHTISAPNGHCAWLVIEGQEDPAYKSVCWTNAYEPDLTKLYKPMSQADICLAIERVLQNIPNG